MTSTSTLSVFIFHHHQNGICNKNFRSIQDIMHTSEPDFEKYKKVCDVLPNLTILTKSATSGEVQQTFSHTYVGNKRLGESVAEFTMAVSPDSPSVVLINININFVTDGDKYSFAPPLVTSQGRRSSRTGYCATPSSSHHS